MVSHRLPRISTMQVYFPFAFSPPAADAYSRIAFSRSVGVTCRLSCSARFATSADRAVLFRAFRCSRDSFATLSREERTSIIRRLMSCL